MKQKRVLVCPLNWGLGHATRCIPIINLLIQNNAKVIIAAEGRSLELLKKEFPELEYIVFKGYDITYSKSLFLALKMIFSIPKILNGIKREHRELDKLITDYNIDIVLSDNRYGCWNKKITSVFITHQLMIKSPIGEKVLHKIVLSYIKRYTFCWIPDWQGKDNLSGDLAHLYPIPSNASFIGALTRFNQFTTTEEKKYDVMAIISGPEPQRSIFERIVSEQIYKSNLNALLVFGLPEGNIKHETKAKVKMVSHLNSKEMEEAIRSSDLIISRSGYSTILDLAALGKKAIFIPTPGQTEQEYLAYQLKEKGIAFFQKQKTFHLMDAIEKSKSYSGFTKSTNDLLLEAAVTGLLNEK